jgi:hypothetical protein
MLIAATRYALTKERWWVIPNLVGLQIGLYFDVWLYIKPDTEILAPLVLNLVLAWHLIALTTLPVVLILNVTWLLDISARGSPLARQWASGICLLFCCLWLVLLCFSRPVIGLFAWWIGSIGIRF